MAVKTGPTEKLLSAFTAEYDNLDARRHIRNLHTQARIYGLASVGMGVVDGGSDQPVDLDELWKEKIFFNVWDPLNTSGLIVDQNPNSPTFQKHSDVHVGGRTWHRSRTRTVMNEEPIYIAWTESAFSFAGRSAYQRVLYPLQSFLQSMRTDAMVARKTGLLIAKMQQPGTIVTGIWKAMAGVKRALLREAITDEVLSIGIEEDIASLNLQNVDGAHLSARDNIIKNIAVGVPMPAKMLTQEAFVRGFGEGTQDTAEIAEYIDDVRIEMNPSYSFFDLICMRRAWNPEFYRTVQKEFPAPSPAGYGDVSYEQAFYEWSGGFTATWPNLLKEPESDLVEVDDVKMKAVIALVQVISPLLDPGNKVRLLRFLDDAVSQHETLFAGARLDFDWDALEGFLQKQQSEMSESALAEEEGSARPQRPFSSHDGADAAIADLVTELEKRRRSLRPVGGHGLGFWE